MVHGWAIRPIGELSLVGREAESRQPVQGEPIASSTTVDPGDPETYDLTVQYRCDSALAFDLVVVVVQPAYNILSVY